MRNKKIIIYAYVNLNFGDDLFIDILCSRYPNVKFYILAPKKYKTHVYKGENLKVYNRDSFFIKVIAKISGFLGTHNYFEKLIEKNVDGIVRIGGSIFRYQHEDWEHWEEKNRKYIKERQNLQKPYFLLGCNFGPVDDKRFIETYKNLFSTYRDICFRDRHSYKLFNELKNVRYATDIAFSLNISKPEIIEKHVVISVKNFENSINLSKYYHDYIEKIIEICNYFIECGIRVKLVSFCSIEKDNKSVDLIYNSMDDNKIKSIDRIYYQGDIEQIINLFNKASFIIATRFHAMVLGWLVKKQVFPIVYEEKMKNIIDDVKFSGLYTYVEDINNLNMMQIQKSYDGDNSVDITKLQKDAQVQFEKLDQFLN